jgi:beta-glucanase (GH16 family)
MKIRSLLGVMVLALPLAVTQAAPAAAAIGPLTWADEFNAAANTPINSARWTHDVGGGGWGNNQLEYDTNSTRNVAHDGAGNLVITARRENAGLNCWYGPCQYTSARIKTQGKFTQRYGRFEARLKIPRGQGIWPAFWMLGDNIGSVGWPNSGEIDIMENIGREPNRIHGSLHGPGYSGGNPLTGSTTIGGAYADAFHTFAVDWGPTSVTWLVDGVAYQTKTSSQTNGNPWVFDHPFFLIFNVAVGGNWPGSPDASSPYPQTMLIDYVRVYSWTDGGGGGRVGQITGFGNKCIDVASSGTANGTAIQLWGCNGTGAQRWTIGTDGTIRALGKCMDVAGAGTANGTLVQLWDCNGTGAQVWQYQSNRTLRNPNSNKCLDATGNSSADGTRLQIWDCAGSANQQWNLPA